MTTYGDVMLYDTWIWLEQGVIEGKARRISGGLGLSLFLMQKAILKKGCVGLYEHIFSGRPPWKVGDSSRQQ